MPQAPRNEKMTLRLSAREAKLLELLAEHLGGDESGALRQSLLEKVRREGITLPEDSGLPPKPLKKQKPGA